ncbi:hypothetical protein [Vreelandella lionensis]|uniref:hypothetical protein n=1 Tax=Vreelandella lionensis TaxID=1144478 RepID=UPI00111C344A|nr:hypothetical protein [Halomonas lionensis]
MTNNSGAGATAATIENLVAQTASDGNTLTIDGTEYVGQSDGTITFNDTASATEVEQALTQATTDSTVTLGDGFESAL